VGRFDHIAEAILASPLTAAFIEMAEAGDFSRLEKSEAKRQHFVPQLLLRSFAHEFNGKPYLFQMETRSRRAPLRVDVRAAASRHYNLHWGHRLLSHYLDEAGIAHEHRENPGNHGGCANERYQVALQWLSQVLDSD
jgi:hypothetical protein